MPVHPNNIKTRFQKGHIHSEQVRRKISEANKIRFQKGTLYNLGKPHSEETKRKLREAWARNRESRIGKNHWAYKDDRTTLLKQDRRGDPLYFEWRRQVHSRDAWKCKINNNDCSGRIEVHHILGWTKYLELRYEVNNGITLCHNHHPRKRIEEKQLVPVFQSLVLSKI